MPSVASSSAESITVHWAMIGIPIGSTPRHYLELVAPSFLESSAVRRLGIRGVVVLLFVLFVGILGWKGLRMATRPDPKRVSNVPMFTHELGSVDSAPEEAREEPASRRTLDARQIALRLERATTTVICGSSQGAGFFVGPSLVVTNAHVVEPALDEELGDETRIYPDIDGRRESIPITIRGIEPRTYRARILRVNRRLDIALLRVPEANAQPLPLGDATRVQRGDTVYTMGSPQGLSATMSQGIVSNSSQPLMGKSYVQVDLNIDRGSSGGPVVDDHGRVIGVVTLAVDGLDGMGLALAANYLYAGSGLMSERDHNWNERAWDTTRRRAREQAHRERAQAMNSMNLPILIRAEAGPRDLVAAVLMFGDELPSELRFHVEGGAWVNCNFTGEILEWTDISESLRDRLSFRMRQWIDRSGEGESPRVGAVHADWSECSEHVGSRLTLVLDDAPPRLDRVAFSVKGVRFDRRRPRRGDSPAPVRP